MLTVTLKPDVAEHITRMAESTHLSAEVVVDKALRAYVAQTQRAKLEAETAAFDRQHAELLTRYAGSYIAMHDGQVIAHHTDLRALHQLVFQQLGHTPVLLKKVTAEPETELVIRHPRLEAI